MAVVLTALPSACAERDLSLPSAADVEKAYLYDGTLTAEMRGNVAEVRVVQPVSQLQRGGSLWARVGPYVLLFSEETRQLFERFPGLAAVRVVTLTPAGEPVAEALLPRDTLNDLTWRRSLNVAGVARRDGTRQPVLLEDLVRWGEGHTRYSYDSAWVGR